MAGMVVDLGFSARRPAQHEKTELAVGVNQIPRVGFALVQEDEALKLGRSKVQSIKQLLDFGSPQVEAAGTSVDSLQSGNEGSQGLHKSEMAYDWLIFDSIMRC